jgi:Asp-tRNA(Asn)/Glu-tRNA(Gln) amidotransferase A subunit family amidase
MSSLHPNRLRVVRGLVSAWIAITLAGCLMLPQFSWAAETADINVVELTASDAEAALSSHQYSSRQLTDAFLQRIKTYNPLYNAIITLNPKAPEEADESDRRRAAGQALGPLDGIPVVVKDTMDVAGLPTTAGWSHLSARAGGIDLIPATDAPVIARLRAAGAVILGKTNVPVFSVSGETANDSWAGPTYNAAAPLRAPGASSSGTATAVAASFAVLGLGEETGGSIQNPSAAQALVGIKPTFGLVPNAGVVPLGGSTRDVVGPLAKTVHDAAIVLDVLAGYTAEDPKTVASFGHTPVASSYAAGLADGTLQGKRIGLFGPGWYGSSLSPETQRLYQQVIEELKREGAIVVEDPFAGSGFAALERVSGDGSHYDQRGEESVAYDLQNYLARLGPHAAAHTFAELVARSGQDPFASHGPLGYELEYPPTRSIVAASLQNLSRAPDLGAFRAAREQYIATFNKVMDRDRLDALIYPQSLSEVPRLFDKELILPTSTSALNIGGFPGICVPAGYYASGTPFGIIIIGRLWDESNLLRMAYAYEQHTHARRVPQLIESRAELPKEQR